MQIADFFLPNLNCCIATTRMLLFFCVSSSVSDATAAWVFFSGRDILHPLLHTCTKIEPYSSFLNTEKDFFFFLVFPIFLCFEPLLSLAVIHPPQKYRFLRGRLHISSFPLSAGEPSSPVNPPSLLTRL